jgi:hypothetical protein
MPVSEIKRWTAIMVLVGLIMSIGGSYALTKAAVHQNTIDIVELKESEVLAREILQKGIDDNYASIQSLQDCQANTLSDISAMKTDIRWICITLEDIAEELDVD